MERFRKEFEEKFTALFDSGDIELFRILKIGTLPQDIWNWITSNFTPKSEWVSVERSELYKTAINKWGAESQINMLVEECAELIVGINKYRRTGSDNLLEEIADVEIMLEQARMILGEENSKIVDIHKKDKLNRLADKLSIPSPPVK